MSKATSIKEAIKKWEEKHGVPANEAKYIGLQFRNPPIEKLDANISSLINCVKLSLSSNMIDRISGFNLNMKNLRILSLGRNYIKSLAGLEALTDTLEELWLSYNQIDKLKGIESMKKLKVFYISFNNIRDWGEFSKLQSVKTLEDLLMVGNPIYDNMDEKAYRKEALKILPFLKKLDGEPVTSNVIVYD